jgi:threonine dehydratase
VTAARAADATVPRPTVEDVLAARARIADMVHRSPLEPSPWLSGIAGQAVHLKLECWQPTRSFKVRGATNALMARAKEARARGVATASAGNHGQAVARAAAAVDARATIFVPADAPAAKKARIRSYGAALDESAANYDEAEVAARAFAERTGALFVHAFSDPDVVAGQGTVGLEIAEMLPEARNVVVPVGGGGLIAGIGTVLRMAAPAARVIGVQSVATRAMYDAFRAGGNVDSPITPTIADGLAGCTDEASYQRVRAIVDAIHLVEEGAIAEAMRGLFVHDGVVAEGSGAVGVAAVATGQLRLDGPTVVVVTGGNVDADRFARILRGEPWAG